MTRFFHNMKLYFNFIYFRILILIINLSIKTYLFFIFLQNRYLHSNNNLIGLPIEAIEVRDNYEPYFLCLLSNKAGLELDKLIKNILIRIVLQKCYNHNTTNIVTISFIKDNLFYHLDEIITITPSTDIFILADDLYTLIYFKHEFLKYTIIVTVTEN